MALNYCQHYLVSQEKLAEYLKRKVHLGTANDVERGELLNKVPSLVSQMTRLGFVNDKEAASAKLRSTLRSGYAPSVASGLAAVKAKVDINVLNDMLAETLRESFPDLEGSWDGSKKDEFLARAALSRSRRGPFRGAKRTQKTDQRDMAWLKRRGYRYEEICRAMKLDPDDFF